MNAKQTKPIRRSNLGITAKQTNLNKSAPQPVRFEYRNGGARTVSLAGSFNDWRPEKMELIPLGGGTWAKDLQLAPGTYEYRLVVDGQWLTDPSATEITPNPFGGQNSIKRVHTPPAPRLLATPPAVGAKAPANK